MEIDMLLVILVAFFSGAVIDHALLTTSLASLASSLAELASSPITTLVSILFGIIHQHGVVVAAGTSAIWRFLRVVTGPEIPVFLFLICFWYGFYSIARLLLDARRRSLVAASAPEPAPSAFSLVKPLDAARLGRLLTQGHINRLKKQVGDLQAALRAQEVSHATERDVVEAFAEAKKAKALVDVNNIKSKLHNELAAMTSSVADWRSTCQQASTDLDRTLDTLTSLRSEKNALVSEIVSWRRKAGSAEIKLATAHHERSSAALCLLESKGATERWQKQYNEELERRVALETAARRMEDAARLEAARRPEREARSRATAREMAAAAWKPKLEEASKEAEAYKTKYATLLTRHERVVDDVAHGYKKAAERRARALGSTRNMLADCEARLAESQQELASRGEVVARKETRDVGVDARVVERREVRDVGVDARVLEKKEVRDVGVDARPLVKVEVRDVGVDAPVLEERGDARVVVVREEDARAVVKKEVRDVGVDARAIEEKEDPVREAEMAALRQQKRWALESLVRKARKARQQQKRVVWMGRQVEKRIGTIRRLRARIDYDDQVQTTKVDELMTAGRSLVTENESLKERLERDNKTEEITWLETRISETTGQNQQLQDALTRAQQEAKRVAQAEGSLQEAANANRQLQEKLAHQERADRTAELESKLVALELGKSFFTQQLSAAEAKAAKVEGLEEQLLGLEITNTMLLEQRDSLLNAASTDGLDDLNALLDDNQYVADDNNDHLIFDESLYVADENNDHLIFDPVDLTTPGVGDASINAGVEADPNLSFNFDWNTAFSDVAAAGAPMAFGAANQGGNDIEMNNSDRPGSAQTQQPAAAAGFDESCIDPALLALDREFEQEIGDNPQGMWIPPDDFQSL